MTDAMSLRNSLEFIGYNSNFSMWKGPWQVACQEDAPMFIIWWCTIWKILGMIWGINHPDVVCLTWNIWRYFNLAISQFNKPTQIILPNVLLEFVIFFNKCIGINFLNCLLNLWKTLVNIILYSGRLKILLFHKVQIGEAYTNSTLSIYINILYKHFQKQK